MTHTDTCNQGPRSTPPARQWQAMAEFYALLSSCGEAPAFFLMPHGGQAVLRWSAQRMGFAYIDGQVCDIRPVGWSPLPGGLGLDIGGDRITDCQQAFKAYDRLEAECARVQFLESEIDRMLRERSGLEEVIAAQMIALQRAEHVSAMARTPADEAIRPMSTVPELKTVLVHFLSGDRLVMLPYPSRGVIMAVHFPMATGHVGFVDAWTSLSAVANIARGWTPRA